MSQISVLFNVHCPNQPDYDNLRMDIQKKLAKVRIQIYKYMSVLFPFMVAFKGQMPLFECLGL